MKILFALALAWCVTLARADDFFFNQWFTNWTPVGTRAKRRIVSYFVIPHFNSALRVTGEDFNDPFVRVHCPRSGDLVGT